MWLREHMLASALKLFTENHVHHRQVDMVRPAILFAVGVLLIGSSRPFSQDALPPLSDRVPVLAELFTSEGCSSCPPADRFIQALDSQPIPGLEVIVLSEHVDYWNHEGWSDPYSSPEFSERQRAYSKQFNLPDPYTPQLVIDGSWQVSGNSASEAVTVLRSARKQLKTGLHITQTDLPEKGRIRVQLNSDPLRLSDGPRSLEVYLVIALNRVESQVTNGENANRLLTHAAVVRTIKRVGKLMAGEQFSQNVELKIDAKTDPRNLRVVAFLQDAGSGKVFAATMSQVLPR
jgi:hypothetical protein